MRSMTLEQLRAARNAGGVADVTLKGQGGIFLVQITTGSGANAVLAKARSSQPRRFGNPAVALNVLRDVGITTGQFDEASGTRPRGTAPRDKWACGSIAQGALRRCLFRVAGG